MSTSTFVGNSDGLGPGLCPAPPPPPPPPPAPGQVPTMRINTVEPPSARRPQIANNDGYEPPAAIQNAMLTKDKKPFTYTPGMGGKLDLSQIRSPRMARRVAKNANDEGIEGPPKSAIEPKPAPVANSGANLFVQPQVAIPVFPTNVPAQSSANKTPLTPTGSKTPSTSPANRTPSTPPANRTPPMSPIYKTTANGSERQTEPPKPVKVETKVMPVASAQPSSPDSPSTPTQVTLAKAPTPWLQNKNKQQEELPEWAKRSSMNKQSSSPDSPTSPPVYVPVQQTQQQPQWQPAQPTQQKQQLSQPTLQSQQSAQQRPQSQQSQQFPYQQPQQFNQQQKRPFSSPPVTQQMNPQSQPQERVIPIRIEDRPSVFDVPRESGHHQFKQPSPHHQQRWGQQSAQNQVLNEVPQPQESSGGGYIIPIVVEGSEKKPVGGTVSNASYSQPIVRNNTTAENQTVKVIPQRGPAVLQSEGGPVQSRSFRVLQKITDTDSMDNIEPDQLRKLQLTDDDRNLMNRIREQVDNDSFLHHEEDPRYRGAAIPSRAFRFLQTMTESGEVPAASTTVRPPSAINKRQNRNSKTFEETQTNLPPSEQQVPEPKKYMGSAIPSKSFRILQAMTTPESVATQENRQADYTCQTENNVPGNQQVAFLPSCPPPFWSPDGGWWSYYPLLCPGTANDSYPYHPENTAYIYFPIYNQNCTGNSQHGIDSINAEKSTCSNVYPPSYGIPVPPPSNCKYASTQALGNAAVSKIEPIASVPDSKDSEVKVQKGNNNLNGLNSIPQWDRPNSVTRTASTISKDSDCTTAMNITDEEEIPATIPSSEANESVNEIQNCKKNPCSNGNFNVTVPNYTYIDTSDSSNSSDSESQSDNESIIESSKSDSDSEDTSSDSDDSDSYLAYSTGLNPHGRFERDIEKSGIRTSSSKESCNRKDESESSFEKNSDLEVEEQLASDEGKVIAETFPHKLSVIYEDIEQVDSESPRLQETRTVEEWNETPFEATDDPPDEQDTTTVSVSLPLRFKFSVSENNEDVTTVIVGDSTIKPEKPYSKDDYRDLKGQEHRDKTSEVFGNFQVSNETSVDFIVKEEAFDSKRRAKSYSNEKEKEEIVEKKLEKSEEPVVPHVNFTLRKIPTRLSRVNCEETVETEFTIKPRRTSAKKEESKIEKEQEDCSANLNLSSYGGGNSLDKEKSFDTFDNSTHTVSADEPTFETYDYNKNILKPEVIVSTCKDTSSNYQRTILKAVEEIPRQDGNVLRKGITENEVEEKMKEAKHLLSVQNSRDETDDEDSGVTSDMSRRISEVDTDSECTSSRNIQKYQRTQTHSRLFKLLNDDSILAEDSEQPTNLPSRKAHLSLPLNNTSNYDDNYCSNYSSCHTSPDYSPVCEQSWRRLHDTDNCALASSPKLAEQSGDAFRRGYPFSRQDRNLSKDDPYYQAWKTSKSPAPSNYDAMPSQAFKILESKRPPWAYKVNVLCPRIKSTKNVPQTLESRKIADLPIPPLPTSDSLVASSPTPTSLTCAILRSDYC